MISKLVRKQLESTEFAVGEFDPESGTYIFRKAKEAELAEGRTYAVTVGASTACDASLSANWNGGRRLPERFVGRYVRPLGQMRLFSCGGTDLWVPANGIKEAKEE